MIDKWSIHSDSHYCYLDEWNDREKCRGALFPPLPSTWVFFTITFWLSSHRNYSYSFSFSFPNSFLESSRFALRLFGFFGTNINQHDGFGKPFVSSHPCFEYGQRWQCWRFRQDVTASTSRSQSVPRACSGGWNINDTHGKYRSSLFSWRSFQLRGRGASTLFGNGGTYLSTLACCGGKQSFPRHCYRTRFGPLFVCRTLQLRRVRTSALPTVRQGWRSQVGSSHVPFGPQVSGRHWRFQE